MPLLVVPLGAGETHLLTLDEWDALRGCAHVLFERGDHPLRARLEAEGVRASILREEPDPSVVEQWGLVAEPGSPRVAELADAGAMVRIGTSSAPDALSAARGAPVVRRAASSLGSLVAVMARLRGPRGCPWDREQSHESLRVHLLEEAHEVLEAIDRGTLGAELKEELGDVLLQVAFHAQLAAEDGRFDIAGVADVIVAKLVARHPHVFGDVEVSGADEVVANWEAMKGAESEADGPFDGIPRSLPALLACYKAQKRAARFGFHAQEDEARARARALLADGASADRIGEALFWLVAVARAGGIDPEGALRKATATFIDSFR